MLLAAACAPRGGTPERLSEWGLFEGPLARHRPAPGVVPYEINTPLFSDYATKLRMVRVPAGTKVSYREDGVLDFPVGTVISKTFAYPRDPSDPQGPLRLVETRLLVHRPQGWVGLPYIWNPEQTDAQLEITGGSVPVRFAVAGGTVRELTYHVPNANQCKGCHKTDGETMAPIGPRAAQLNREHLYVGEGGEQRENQLLHWYRVGILAGGPESRAQLKLTPRYAVWDDPSSGTLDQRARAWLEINCAHCHNPAGPARTSSLDLRVANADPTQLGVYKSPVAAGRGSGDRLHDLVPGHPERSILIYRLESLDPGVMMPELGRSVVHEESLELLRQWVRAMPDPFEGRGLGSAEQADGAHG